MMIEQLVPGFRAETARERALAGDADLLEGLAWGRPRHGHPEGPVGHHVAQLLRGMGAHDPLREELRFLALLHDARKVAVRPAVGYSRDNDHAVLARRLAEAYTADERLLDTLELHDWPYHIWRTRTDDGRADLAALLARVPDRELFLRFVELDGSTYGKDPGLLYWVRAATGATAAGHPYAALAA
jgi:hypothetical protein